MIKIEENKVTEQKANGWLIALSIIIPLAGLIIFISQKDKQPKTAKTCGICALISFVISIYVFFILSFVILVTTVTPEEKSGALESTQNSREKNVIEEAKDTVTLNITEALCEYLTEGDTSNKNADISQYIREAIVISKNELINNGVRLSSSGNMIYLTSDMYQVTGTISESGNITWSDIIERIEADIQ